MSTGMLLSETMPHYLGRGDMASMGTGHMGIKDQGKIIQFLQKVIEML
jgi:hypothetical protein